MRSWIKMEHTHGKGFCYLPFTIILIRLRVRGVPISDFINSCQYFATLKSFLTQDHYILFYSMYCRKKTCCSIWCPINNVSSGKRAVPYHFSLGPNANRGCEGSTPHNILERIVRSPSSLIWVMNYDIFKDVSSCNSILTREHLVSPKDSQFLKVSQKQSLIWVFQQFTVGYKSTKPNQWTLKFVFLFFFFC